MSRITRWLVGSMLFTGFYGTVTAQLLPEVRISQKQYQVPVLILKKDNPILRIKITVPGNGEKEELTGMIFSTSGTSAIKDIQQARLYYSGSDSGAVRSGSFQQANLFGTAGKVSEKISIKGSQSLPFGDHYFWLSYELTGKADMMHVVDANCITVSMGKRTINPEPGTDKIRQRIGIAIRQHMQDSVHTHRIPGITTTKIGTLLAVYDARRESARDLQGNIDIGLSRSVDGGNTWEKIRVAMDMHTWGGLPEKFNGVSDANILTDEKTGTIFLTGLWMHGVLNDEGIWIENLSDTSKAWNHQWRNKGSQPGFDVKQTSQFLIVKSTDDGKTWSEPVNLTRMCKRESWWLWAPGPGHGITLTDGTLVFPTQGRDNNGKPFSNITYSKDGGNTWKTTAAADTGSTTESMAVQLTDGSVMLNMRANNNSIEKGPNNGRAIATTTNLGETWTTHPTSRQALQEPVCMASIHKHSYIKNGLSKSILLFANPNTKTGRHHITIKVSFDDGLTWPERNWILLDEWNSRGYSCITSVDNNTVGILYESSMSDLVFQRFTVAEVIK